MTGQIPEFASMTSTGGIRSAANIAVEAGGTTAAAVASNTNLKELSFVD